MQRSTLVRSTRETSAGNPVDDLPGDFREISVDDTDRLLQMFDSADKRAWCYYTPFLNCYHLPPGRSVLVGTFESSTCILSRTDRKQVIYNWVVPPVPFDGGTMDRLSNTLREMTTVDPRVQWCDEADAGQASKHGFKAEEKEQEYMYNPSQVAEMEGPAYKELRKRFTRANRRYEPTVDEMTREDVPACHDLLKRWRKLQGRKHSFLLDWGYTRAALDRFGDWSVRDLNGWCVKVDGRISAFGMAGRMRSDQACFFVAKSDPELPGLSEVLRVHIYRALSACQLVNDAGDLDLPGLRQHKRRFRPVEMRPVYTLHRE